MNKIKNSETTFVKDLAVGDRFTVPRHTTPYVCEKVYTDGNLTRISYRMYGTTERYEFVKVNLATVYVLSD